MIALLFSKMWGETRLPEESASIVPHWSEVEREIPPHYAEWVGYIAETLRDDYRASLPPKPSKKCKRKFVKFGENS